MPSPVLWLLFSLPRKYQPSLFFNRNTGEGHVGVLWSALLVKSTLIVLPAKGGDTLKGSLGGRQRGKAGQR